MYFPFRICYNEGMEWRNVTEQRSRIMRAIRRKDTKPELLLRGALSALGLHHRYRLHRKDLPGTPDVVFPRARVAVFVDGDFWHGRRRKLPANNKELWHEKFRRNRERDRRVDLELEAMGWLPLRFWESDVNADAPAIASRVLAIVTSRTP